MYFKQLKNLYFLILLIAGFCTSIEITAYKPKGIYVACTVNNLVEHVIFYGKLNATLNNIEDADFELKQFTRFGNQMVAFDENVQLKNGTLWYHVQEKSLSAEYEYTDSQSIVLQPLVIAVTAYFPRGVRFSVPYADGIESFAIWAHVNRPTYKKQVWLYLEAFEPVNGEWIVEKDDVELKRNDVLNYTLHIKRYGELEKYTNSPVLAINNMKLRYPGTTTTSSPNRMSTVSTPQISTYGSTTTAATTTRPTTFVPFTTTAPPPTITTYPPTTSTTTPTTSPVTTTWTTPKTTTPTSTTPTTTTNSNEHEELQCYREFAHCISGITQPLNRGSEAFKASTSTSKSTSNFHTSGVPTKIIYYNGRGTTRTNVMYPTTRVATSLSNSPIPEHSYRRYFHTTSNYYQVNVNITAFYPRGLQVTLPFEKQIDEFYFWANINNDVEDKNDASIKLSGFSQINGIWSAIDRHAYLTKGDVVHYILFVRKNGLLYKFPARRLLINNTYYYPIDSIPT